MSSATRAGWAHPTLCGHCPLVSSLQPRDPSTGKNRWAGSWWNVALLCVKGHPEPRDALTEFGQHPWKPWASCS